VSGGKVSEFAPPWAASTASGAGSVSDDLFLVGLTTVRTAPSAARHKAAVVLHEWNVSAEHAATVLLLISELVTNAVAFGNAPGVPVPAQMTLALWRLTDGLVIEVSDQSAELPVRRPAGWDSESGRGLNLVNDLSREWGCYIPGPRWKTVYCVVATVTMTTPSLGRD
jgi:anti-sigma regulatory factor (Ser/Thr protein kinase)